MTKSTAKNATNSVVLPIKDQIRTDEKQRQYKNSVVPNKDTIVAATKNITYPNSTIKLANNKIYNIKNTLGDDNNCLIYAITKGNIGSLNRRNIFSYHNVRECLVQILQKNIKKGNSKYVALYILIDNVKHIYSDQNFLQSLDKEHNLNLDILAQNLSRHIIFHGCFLDTQIAAPVIAKHLQKNILIISPDARDLGRLSYNLVYDNGQTKHKGELDKSQLNKIEEDYPEAVFIYNANGTHFEWLEEVTNNVQNVS